MKQLPFHCFIETRDLHLLRVYYNNFRAISIIILFINAVTYVDVIVVIEILCITYTKTYFTSSWTISNLLSSMRRRLYLAQCTGIQWNLSLYVTWSPICAVSGVGPYRPYRDTVNRDTNYNDIAEMTILFTAQCYVCIAKRGMYRHGTSCVYPSVSNMEVLWSHKLENFENNFTVD